MVHVEIFEHIWSFLEAEVFIQIILESYFHFYLDKLWTQYLTDKYKFSWNREMAKTLIVKKMGGEGCQRLLCHGNVLEQRCELGSSHEFSAWMSAVLIIVQPRKFNAYFYVWKKNNRQPLLCHEGSVRMWFFIRFFFFHVTPLTLHRAALWRFAPFSTHKRKYLWLTNSRSDVKFSNEQVLPKEHETSQRTYKTNMKGIALCAVTCKIK